MSADVRSDLFCLHMDSLIHIKNIYIQYVRHVSKNTIEKWNSQYNTYKTNDAWIFPLFKKNAFSQQYVHTNTYVPDSTRVFKH